ncbi:YML083C [Saccharomyces arboricola H-6]|uniref:YML083C n=1 Tax=Saccharomyces arboricola (strain H-6 / AS 2.3317 / CBS 10644) TaxID=1160507 RepID=J8Q4G8_SACAR|nr:YML083C [Saccharomyces arboricola H-6]
MDYLHVYNNDNSHVPRTPPIGKPCLSPVLPPIILALDQQRSQTFGYSSPRRLPTPVLPPMSSNGLACWSQQVLSIPVPVRSNVRVIPMVTPMASPRPQFEVTTTPSPSLPYVAIKLPDLKLPPSPVCNTTVDSGASLPILPKIVIGTKSNNEELVRRIPDHIECARTKAQLSKVRSGKQLLACAQAYHHPVNENEIDNINSILDFRDFIFKRPKSSFESLCTLSFEQFVRVYAFFSFIYRTKKINKNKYELICEMNVHEQLSNKRIQKTRTPEKYKIHLICESKLILSFNHCTKTVKFESINGGHCHPISANHIIKPSLFLTHCIRKCHQTIRSADNLKLALRDTLKALDHERIGLQYLKRRHFKTLYQALSPPNTITATKNQEDNNTLSMHMGIIPTGNFFMFNASSDIFQRH